MDEIISGGPEFFDIRYAACRMPWDYGGVPNLLKTFLDTHHGPGRVLIPGCGSGYEIATFHSVGWDVIGIDFSKVAVARAKAFLGPLADKVREADFFTYPLRNAPFDIVYERTFLCTLEADRRSQYAWRMAELVALSGLLCGFFFFGPEDEPPPYPISEDQLDQLLGRWFEKIEDRMVEDSLPLYAGKERWQIWRRKGPPVSDLVGN
jgi:hypothetical protein